MWNFFKRKPFLPEADQEFVFECYHWLLTYFGGDHFYNDVGLVPPTERHFPTMEGTSEEVAQKTFLRVKRYAQMKKWKCRFKAQEEDPDPGPMVFTDEEKYSAGGTFSIDKKGRVTITYNPSIVSDPVTMIATFAHELGHYLTSTAPVPPPGGWENWEYLTDITAVFMGFGIFQANAAALYINTGLGWRSSNLGYLTEKGYCYVLAIFILLKGIDPKAVYPHCNTNIKQYLKRAIKELNKSSVIDDLWKVKYRPYAF
ncbi:MAG: hypothetical protein HRT89_16350 [Lentisphaeria bacterium]|nr:hypothetical protein [Lentisphaeria bacterium]NQZ69631.1 hypothetical protein [Lentisphaeria bacterium]